MPIFRRSKHLTIILTHTYVFVNAVAYDKRHVLVGLQYNCYKVMVLTKRR